MNQIELLYFDGCPSWQAGLQALEEALASGGFPAAIRLVKITSPDRAEAERFLGSPSFRVNGIDLWPEQRSQYALSCRVYATPQGLIGCPTANMLLEEIRRCLSSSPTG